MSNDSCREVSRGECVEISNVTKFERRIKIEGTVCGLSDALALIQTSAIGLAPQPRHTAQLSQPGEELPSPRIASAHRPHCLTLDNLAIAQDYIPARIRLNSSQ